MSFSWFGQSYIFLSRLYLITSTPFILFGFFQGMTVKNKCLQNERTVVVVVYKRLLILPMIFSTIASQRRYTYFFLILFMRCKTKLWLIRFKIKSNKSVCEILSQFRSLFWTQLFGAQVKWCFWAVSNLYLHLNTCSVCNVKNRTTTITRVFGYPTGEYSRARSEVSIFEY